MRVLVVNAGSSSLKLRLLDAQDTVSRSADLPDGAGTSALAGILRGWETPDAVGHRIVHGGTVFTGPVLRPVASLGAGSRATPLTRRRLHATFTLRVS
jgi:acetate kinase